MRKFAGIAIASMLFAGVGSAQYKVPQQAASQPAQASPVKIEAATNVQLQAAAEPSLESARRIPREEAMKLVKEKKAVFVDVRSKESYDEGHIPGAISIPLSELLPRIKELPPKKFIITYCA